MDSYDFQKIEKKWQGIWKKNNYGQAEDFSKKPKHYNLVEFPYPSGAGLHVGHCMGYGASDAYCRMKRMQGFNVMYPMGWDAFGLPTENYAIANKIKPQDATLKNIATFKKQMKALGYSFDWSREINTTDPNYYKWTQWIFLQFYRHAIVGGKLVEVADDDTTTPRLAYRAFMPVNWCSSCKINLANEEVISGRCERCETVVEKRMQTQWLLRITAYANRLINDLEKVDYEERIKTQQINWIGRSEGTNIKFKIDNSDDIIEVFTTRADTLFGCTYMVVAPESDLISKIKDKILNIEEVEKYIAEAKSKSDLERTELEKEKTGVELKGISAINPINNEKIPVWIADYVLSSYGTGACMAVPAHDVRDWEFAKKYNLDIKQVIQNSNLKSQNDNSKLENAFAEYGILTNSDEFDGTTSEEGKKKITEKLKEIDAGDFATNYKLRDWIFSRQHYWGEPIPIIYCRKCWEIRNQKSEIRNKQGNNITIINGEEHMIVPIPEDQLPLELPEVENYEPSNTGESPLASISDWVNTKCPKCGGSAKRETDTMPNWAGSSWYYLRYCDPDSDNAVADKKKMDYWLPIDIYNGGMEHTTLHLLYSRFWHKFLYDLKVAPGPEPYAKRIAHGIILGPDRQKMSKSRGNVINPDEMIEQFGADTLRAYIMFIGPYDQESAWNMAGIRGVFRFLNRVWNNAGLVNDNKDDNELLIKLNQTIKGITEDLETYQLNTIISKLMELNNLIEKKKSVSKESFAIFLKLLYPVCPHIAEELWEISKFDKTIAEQNWPEVDKNYLIGDKITIAIQVNGKLRDTIEVEKDAPEDKVKEQAHTEKIKSFVDTRKVKNIIYVPGKIVNFVIE